jgi:type IV pilus assembly protein PilB
VSGSGATKRVLLGDLLVEHGLITEEQKVKALEAQEKTGRRLGEIVVEMGFAAPEDILRLLAERAGLPFVRLRKGLSDPAIVKMVPRDKAELHEALPLFRIHDKLTIAISEPNRTHILTLIQKLTGCKVQAVVSPKDDILQMINESYEPGKVLIEDLIPDMDGGVDLELVSVDTGAHFEDIAQMAGESPIINLVNQVILKAVLDKASDVHIEPDRNFMRVRFRIDGMLYEVMRQRSDVLPAVVSRLKLMANLDIAERRLPQDGRIQVLAQGRTVDLRFSSLPGVLGEKIVLRVLDKEKGILSLEELGFGAETLEVFRSLLRRPVGLVLVTGPTGSGKTTTLYAALKELICLEKNIITIEDPVEYQFEIVNQNQVREEIGLTFARILRHALRQDPDVLMVGEIRDAETAQIAVQAALTGHLVLSTMHTNDAASSISRLLEIGIAPYLLAPSLVGVIAQRLVRTICPDCAHAYYPTPLELSALGVADKTGMQLKRGRRCPKCFDSGYRGRIGIYELLRTDQEFQHLLLKNPGLEEIRQHQTRHELPTLRSEGIKRVLEGKTTLEELSRAVFVD